jgi:hypothetical protein
MFIKTAEEMQDLIIRSCSEDNRSQILTTIQRNVMQPKIPAKEEEEEKKKEFSCTI